MGRKKKQSDLLTEFEIKIMNVVWTLRSATVNDVVEKLRTYDYAYTTISTVMRGLEQKGILSPVKNGKAHIYVPELSRDEFESKALGHFVKNVFSEEPSLLFKRLVDSENLSLADLDELKDLIDGKLKSAAC